MLSLKAKANSTKAQSISICSNLSLSAGMSRYLLGCSEEYPGHSIKPSSTDKCATSVLLSFYNSTRQSWELLTVCTSFHQALGWPAELQPVDDVL